MPKKKSKKADPMRRQQILMEDIAADFREWVEEEGALDLVSGKHEETYARDIRIAVNYDTFAESEQFGIVAALQYTSYQDLRSKYYTFAKSGAWETPLAALEELREKVRSRLYAMNWPPGL